MERDAKVADYEMPLIQRFRSLAVGDNPRDLGGGLTTLFFCCVDVCFWWPDWRGMLCLGRSGNRKLKRVAIVVIEGLDASLIKSELLRLPQHNRSSTPCFSLKPGKASITAVPAFRLSTCPGRRISQGEFWYAAPRHQKPHQTHLYIPSVRLRRATLASPPICSCVDRGGSKT